MKRKFAITPMSRDKKLSNERSIKKSVFLAYITQNVTIKILPKC